MNHFDSFIKKDFFFIQYRLMILLYPLSTLSIYSLPTLPSVFTPSLSIIRKGQALSLHLPINRVLEVLDRATRKLKELKEIKIGRIVWIVLRGNN